MVALILIFVVVFITVQFAEEPVRALQKPDVRRVPSRRWKPLRRRETARASGFRRRI
jgi:hypothetical protein